MSRSRLSSRDAAELLGISRSTLYGWLAQSDAGEFEVRGQQVTIDYYQRGRRGQGRIQLKLQEVERLLSLMRVAPKPARVHKRQKKQPQLQHITTKLGLPED